MTRVKATIGDIPYAVSISAGRHELTADEESARGGHDAGPAPYELLLAGLGACTAITLRMYAERKAWPLTSAEVNLHYIRGDESARIDRFLTLDGDLTAEQRTRLADIAERTPVTLTLKAGIAIHTTLV